MNEELKQTIKYLYNHTSQETAQEQRKRERELEYKKINRAINYEYSKVVL